MGEVDVVEEEGVEEAGVEVEEVLGDLEAEVEEAGLGGDLQQYLEGLKHLYTPNQYILDIGKL